MIVTEDMREQDSTKRLIESADIIDDDGRATKAMIARAGKIRLTVGSTEYPSMPTFLDAADARHLAAVLLRLADESER